MRLRDYLLNESKKVKFVRFGGLSKVNQKKYGISSDFHKAPANKGIFAFIWPYIESFLFAWKVKYPPVEDDGNTSITKDVDMFKQAKEKYDEIERENRKVFNKFYKENMKKFTYEGWVWTHFKDLPPKMVRRRKGSWVEIHTSDFDKALRLQKHIDMVEINKDIVLNKDMKDPYKTGLGGMMSKDHLEVFIEKGVN
jgi:hypothetical protein